MSEFSYAMTSAQSRRLPWRDVWLPLLAPSLAVFVILWAVFRWLPPGPQFVAESAECDKQVAILLTTHDALELQRATFIIRRLNCNIGSRLPP